jgi:hypothetical protein
MLPFHPVLTHLMYYNSNVYPRDLKSLKISKRYNDEIIHKAKMGYFEYSHSLPNSMERKHIYKELETLRDKIRKLYIHYKKLIETNPYIQPESRNYLKKVMDDFYDVLIIFPSV